MVVDTKAIRLPRVRESCKPCRQRKTRCNAQQPCQSCILRGTEGDCEFQNPAALTEAAGPSGSNSTSNEASPAHHTAPRVFSTSADVHRLKSAIARLQSDLEAVTRREQTEQHKALWANLLNILPPKRVCETLLEYLIQECDWQLHVGNIAPLWAKAVALQAISPGNAITLCISLALPIFVLRHQPSSLYPMPHLSAESESVLSRFAHNLVTDAVKDLEDINAACDFCTYLIYTQALHELPRYVERCEDVAKVNGYLDESHPSWASLSPEDREWRRQVGFKLIGNSRWKQIYTFYDNLADTTLNICRPDLRPVALRVPLDLDLPVDGGAHWPDRASYRVPDPITNASEFRVLRVKPATELERTAKFQLFLMEVTDLVPQITRVQNAATDEGRAEMAHSVYLQLLRMRDVRKDELGLSDDLLKTLDTNEEVQRRLALQILVARSGYGHITGYLLRPWLSSANAASLSPDSGYPTLHARLATAALENAEYCMKSIPLVQAMLPYPQANMIGAFISANLFNAATAFAVPVLRAVQAWRNTGDSDEDVRALPAWPSSFYPFHTKGGAQPPIDWPGSSRTNNPQQSSTRGPDADIAAAQHLGGNVGMYANWILLILDTLTLLKSNYLGKEAEERLRALVDAHHIRDGTRVRNAATHPFDFGVAVAGVGIRDADPGMAQGGFPVGSGVNAELEADLRAISGDATAVDPMLQQGTGMLSAGDAAEAGRGIGTDPAAMGVDLRWLDELLSMDSSIWDGLLRDGSREIGM